MKRFPYHLLYRELADGIRVTLGGIIGGILTTGWKGNDMRPIDGDGGVFDDDVLAVLVSVRAL